MPPTFKWFKPPNHSAFDIWLQECWGRATERDMDNVDLDNGPEYVEIQDLWLTGGEFRILTAKDSLNSTIKFRVFPSVIPSEGVHGTKICEGKMSNPSFKSIIIRIENEFQKIKDTRPLSPTHPPNSEEQRPEENQGQHADTPRTMAAEGLPLPPSPATESRMELGVSQRALPSQPEIDLNC